MMESLLGHEASLVEVGLVFSLVLGSIVIAALRSSGSDPALAGTSWRQADAAKFDSQFDSSDTSAGHTERRSSEREACNIPVCVVSNGREYGCRMTNWTDRGASLEFDRPLFLYREVKLYMDGSLIAHCHVTWMKGQSAGVRFVDTPTRLPPH